MMTDIVIATLPLYAMAVYYYGTRALLLGGFGVIVSSLADGACQLLAGKIPNIRDLSGAVTGLLIPLLLPASAGYSMILLAALFGIAVAKQPFGGMGQNIFNPAAAGTAFAMICWPKSAFAYPIPFERLPAMVDDTCVWSVHRHTAFRWEEPPTLICWTCCLEMSLVRWAALTS